MLKASEFIDRATRAAFVEFTVYNANADMFVLVRLCLETTSSGTVSEHVSPPPDPSLSIPLTAVYHRLTPGYSFGPSHACPTAHGLPCACRRWCKREGIWVHVVRVRAVHPGVWLPHRRGD